MIKYFTTLQNERGDVLPSYRAQVTDGAGSVVTIYADKGGTRFTDASGNNVNYATADEKGRISFYFTPAVGQTLQTLDVAGNLQDGEPDFADSMVLDSLPGSIAQSAVTDLTTDLAAKADDAATTAALANKAETSALARARYSTVAGLLASTAAAQGAGTVYRTAKNDFVEAASAAADHQLVTAGGAKLYLADLYTIKASAMGCDPAAADNTANLQAAFDLWIDRLHAGIPCRLHIDADYTFTSPIVVTSTANITAGGQLDMTGGRLISNLSASGVPFTFQNRALCRNIDFINFNIYGSANDTITCYFDCGDVTATPKAYFYGSNFHGTRIENAPNIAWQFDGNYFEFVIAESNIICTGTTAGKYGIYLAKTGSNNPSSVDIKGGSYRGGQYALYSVCPDTKVFGGTYIETGSHCIFLQAQNAGGCTGVHVENSHVGGSGSNLAGIKLTNQGFVKDCYGTSNGTGAMDTVVEAFSAGSGIDVESIYTTGSTSKAVYVPSGGGTNLRIKNVARSRITFAALAENRLASVDGNGKLSRNSTASGAIATNFDTVTHHDLLMTGNVSFSAPTNGTVGDRLTVTVQQDATGSRTVVWDAAAFRVKTAVDATANLRTSWEFVFTGGLWIEVSGVAGIPA